MKELKINIPDGHEIDLDKSDLSKGIVFFKESKKILNYEMITEKLFKDKTIFFLYVPDELGPTTGGNNIDLIAKCKIKDSLFHRENHNLQVNSTTREQLESILALNKLCNVAKYLNEDWIPDWNILTQKKYYICLDRKNGKIQIEITGSLSTSIVFFKSKDLAIQAIDILGKEEIRKALTLNH